MTASISYQPFEDLIACLRAEERSKDADLMDHLIHRVAWTTGSELIGELGQAIKRIENSDSYPLSSAIQTKIDECFEMVRRVWPDFPR